MTSLRGNSSRNFPLRVWRNGSVRVGGLAIVALALVAILAPWLYTIDPTTIDPSASHLRPWSWGEYVSLEGEVIHRLFPMGTDSLGRDIWSRTAYGARVSLTVGVITATVAVTFGLLVGLLTGYFRRVDAVLMRVMDGVMAIPGIMFAITLVAMAGPSLATVVFAIALPEVPRVARLMRSVVMSVRAEPYVEAAVALDTPTWLLMLRHILPNATAPMIVQASYVCASAILLEAVLSFLGVGLPSDIPTWGNIMSEGRNNFMQYPYMVLLPGLVLAATILAVNIIGDGLRDVLDPKLIGRSA